MAKLPNWATPTRQAELSELLMSHLSELSEWKLDISTGEFFNLQYLSEMRFMIADWKDDDRYLWKLEREAIHSLGERRHPIEGRYNNISMDIFHDKQPLYYLECLGVSGLTLKPFARVKLGSSYMRLYVDIGDTLKGVSKNKRHKMLRYGKQAPTSTENDISHKIWLAVRDYLKY